MTCKDCKDCLSYKVCYAVGRMTERAETCTQYKNKADYVEVVHCGKCKHWIKNSTLPTDTSGLCCYHRIDTDEKDFCNYGKRKSVTDPNVGSK